MMDFEQLEALLEEIHDNSDAHTDLEVQLADYLLIAITDLEHDRAVIERLKLAGFIDDEADEVVA